LSYHEVVSANVEDEMIAWIDFASMILSALLCLYFYAKSASPAALEKKIGGIAYRRCSRFGIIAPFFMTVAAANYVIYLFYPLPVALPESSLGTGGFRL